MTKTMIKPLGSLVVSRNDIKSSYFMVQLEEAEIIVITVRICPDYISKRKVRHFNKSFRRRS